MCPPGLPNFLAGVPPIKPLEKAADKIRSVQEAPARRLDKGTNFPLQGTVDYWRKGITEDEAKRRKNITSIV